MSPVEIPSDEVGAFVSRPELIEVGPPGRPLSGVRLVVKDLFDVAGRVTGAGNPSFAAGRPRATTHAPAVARLVAAGAAIVGKTITDELAYSLAGTNVHHGTPRNVAAPGRVAGGSSSGSAAAVAAGEAELGLGTDTGGSIRVPASFCGLYGWRPTHGAVDATGVVPLAPSFDTVGLLASDIRLLRLGAAALLADAPLSPAPPSPDPRPRLRFWTDALAAVGDAVRVAVVDAVARPARVVDDAGTGADEVTLGLDPAAAADTFRTLQGREAWTVHGGWIRSDAPVMAPDVAERFEAASRVTDDEVAAAEVERGCWRTRLTEALADGAVLVMPAAAGPAPEVDAAPEVVAEARAAALRLTAPAGLAGLPVVVAPFARVDGLPLGVAFVGAPGTDLRLLDLVTRLAWATAPVL